MLTIHCSGGSEMMRAAMDAVLDTDIKIFGVTALTSLDDENTNDIYKRTVYDHVNYMLDLQRRLVLMELYVLRMNLI